MIIAWMTLLNDYFMKDADNSDYFIKDTVKWLLLAIYLWQMIILWRTFTDDYFMKDTD